MSNLIRNGDFSSGFSEWNNGVGGEPFILDSGMVKAKSSGVHTNDVDYRMRQSFSINDEVISGKLTVRGKYRSYAGDENGQVSFRIQIQKPDASWYTALGLLDKTASSGEYNILDEKDVAAGLDQQGNYILQLQCLVETSRDSNYVSQDYNNWNNGGFTLYDDDSRIEKKVDNDTQIATIYKNFNLDGEDSLATLSVTAEAVINDSNGYAKLRIKLKDPNGNWHVLAYVNRTSTKTWWYVLSSEDISGYITADGTYRLQLEAEVKSTQSGVFNYGRFGQINLTRHDYSNGWYDNVSLDVAVKKKKTVIEARGSTPSRGTGLQKTVLENRGMTESESTRVLKATRILLAALGRTEIIGKKVKKTVMEFLGRTGTLFIRSTKIKKTVMEVLGRTGTLLRTAFMKTLPEVCGRTESYVAVKRRPGSAISGLGRSEAMAAKRTAGNVETTYAFIGDTEWDETSGVTTNWIKTKSEILGG